ncbi:MBL fold metallo-hydrolase [Frankia sp. AgB1.8]|nr:MBL fold metallo-hydrolase [Frankia sp. AgB1.8]
MGAMEMVRLLPRLYFLRFAAGHAYLWLDDDGLTLIDCGVAGSGNQIAAAIRRLGRDPADVRQLVLTHFHHDHVGAANEVAAWGDVVISAHRDDAAVIRGEATGTPPVLLDWERPIFQQVTGARSQRRRPCGSTANSTTATCSTSAAARRPWRCQATPQAASPSTCPTMASCSPATPSRAPRTDGSSSGCSTSTETPPSRPCAGRRTWTPCSPASATENRSRPTPVWRYGAALDRLRG